MHDLLHPWLKQLEDCHCFVRGIKGSVATLACCPRKWLCCLCTYLLLAGCISRHTAAVRLLQLLLLLLLSDHVQHAPHNIANGKLCTQHGVQTRTLELLSCCNNYGVLRVCGASTRSVNGVLCTLILCWHVNLPVNCTSPHACRLACCCHGVKWSPGDA